ncbi:MAG TPA: transposase [Candidatus Sulfotelmatobacter sp.]|nr:transposase [Candidatus Sulfotelmatobacter sp.]
MIDEWLKQDREAEDVQVLLKQITKAVLERAMQAELTEQLGCEKHDPAGYNSGNSRNGHTRKILKGDFGELELETPRDGNGEYSPQIIQKNQTRWTGFDGKILSMYARGMTTRDIQSHLGEMYQVEVSPSLISEVTDGVIEQARQWQNRPLEPFYGIVFLDALYVKMRHEGRVENRAVYVAIGINLEGRKRLLSTATSEKNRIQKVLEDGNVKLGNVLSDVFGVSGQLMLDALLKGEAQPAEIAQLAKHSAKKKIPQIAQALEGHQMSDHHRR